MLYRLRNSISISNRPVECQHLYHTCSKFRYLGFSDITGLFVKRSFVISILQSSRPYGYTSTYQKVLKIFYFVIYYGTFLQLTPLLNEKLHAVTIFHRQYL